MAIPSPLRPLLILAGLLNALPAASEPAKLSLPIAKDRLVIAHFMAGQVPHLGGTQSEANFYLPDRAFSNIGGISTVLSWNAWPEPRFPGIKRNFIDLKKVESIDAYVEWELRAAKPLGVDGFHFYIGFGKPKAPPPSGMGPTDLSIARYFAIADAKNIDIKLTLCPSDVSGYATTEEVVKAVADRMKRILQATGNSPHWLRTPDGRLLLFTWDTAGFAPEAKQIADPKLKAEKIARAWDLIEAALGVPIAVIYHGGRRPYKPWRETTDAEYQASLDATLDCFPAINDFFDNPTPGREADIRRTAETCKRKGRAYVKGVMTEMNCSKLRSVRTGAVEMHKISEPPENYGRMIYGAGLSSNLTWCWEQAIAVDSPMVSFGTWNDYEEGHHIAPEVNHNFGFAQLNAWHRARWRGEKPEAVDRVVVFHKRHALDAKARFDLFPPYYASWGHSRADWEKSLLTDEFVDLVSFTTAPAELRYRGKKVADVPAGFSSTQVPLSPGEVRGALVRGGKTVAEVVSPEWITAEPYRYDRMTIVWESDHDAVWRKIFPTDPAPFPTMYAPGPDGKPVWRSRYPNLGSFTRPDPAPRYRGKVATQTPVDLAAAPWKAGSADGVETDIRPGSEGVEVRARMSNATANYFYAVVDFPQGLDASRLDGAALTLDLPDGAALLSWTFIFQEGKTEAKWVPDLPIGDPKTGETTFLLHFDQCRLPGWGKGKSDGTFQKEDIARMLIGGAAGRSQVAFRIKKLSFFSYEGGVAGAAASKRPGDLPLDRLAWSGDSWGGKGRFAFEPGAAGMKVTADLSVLPEKAGLHALAVGSFSPPRDLTPFSGIRFTLETKQTADFASFTAMLSEKESGAKFTTDIKPIKVDGDVLEFDIPFSAFKLPPWGKGRKAAGDERLLLTDIGDYKIGGTLKERKAVVFTLRAVGFVK